MADAPSLLEAGMLLKEANTRLTQTQLEHLGTGEVGYIRKMKSDEVSRCFPEAPDIDPSLDLWALFGADGTPILLTDNRSSTFFKAAEDDLKTVSLH
jgi:hypothetical protein